MKKTTTRGMILFLTAFTLLAMNVSGNGKNETGSSDQTEKAQGVREIKYWYSWTGQIQKNNIDHAANFNETVGKEKGILVTPEYQGTYDELHQKFQAAYVADDAPEIAVMEIASIKTFADNGVITALDDLVNKNNVDMTDFTPGLMDNSYVDGKLYGIPYLRSTPILYLNSTMLESYGLDPLGPKTWKDLETFSRTIHDKDGKIGLCLNIDIWYIEAFMFEAGISPLNKAETKSNINSPEFKAFITYLNEMEEEGIIRVVAGVDSTKVDADFMNQNAAMRIQSTGSLGNLSMISQENGFILNTTFIPSNKTYGVPTGGCNLVISNKASDNLKDGAFSFLKWITEPDQIVYSTTTTGYMPTRVSMKSNENILKLFTDKPQFKVAVDQLAYGNGRPMNPGYKECMVVTKEAIEAVIINNEDIDTVFAEAEAKMSKLLNE